MNFRYGCLPRSPLIGLIALLGLALVSAAPLAAEVYRAQITITENLTWPYEIKPLSEGISVIAIAYEGAAKPVFSNTAGWFLPMGQLDVSAGGILEVVCAAPAGRNSTSESFRLRFGGGVEKTVESDLLILSGPLVNVTDSLSVGVAGVQDTHKVSFNITADQIEEHSSIWISFPSSFNLAGITQAIYYDNDPSNNSDEPVVDSIRSVSQTLILKLNTGTPAAPSSRIGVRFYSVVDTVAGSYQVSAMTVDSSGNVVYMPTASSPFTISPASLFSISISPSSPMTLASDSLVMFTATGHDRYNNVIPGTTFTWDVTIDSCGVVNNGAFRALKLGQCRVSASSGRTQAFSGLLTIVPGAFGRFAFDGYPTTVTAGATFPNPCTVTVYDVNDNKVYSFADSIYFFSTDDSAQFTYNASNRYHFIPADSGRHVFVQTAFRLKLAGLQTVSVTNIADTTTSNPIRVTAAAIDSFSFLSVFNQTAGVSFSLTVNNAIDQYGNPASGSVIISSSYGGGNSPNGVPPVYNNIAVSNGTGIAMQTLTNAVRTVLQGSFAGFHAYTDTFRVGPGVASDLSLTNYPDTAVAGQAFSTNPRVTVTDAYGNLNYNFNHTVAFSGAEVVPPPYTFVPAVDSGSHSFPGSGFTFQLAGSRWLIATDLNNNALTDTSSAIQVRAGPITSFVLTAPSTVVAGSIFAASVTAAEDEYGNPAGGTVNMLTSYGGGNSPGGMPPTLSDIIVNSGSGTAGQRLTNAVRTVLRGQTGGFFDDTDTIQVNSGAAQNLSMIGYPDTITAGQPFPLDITVNVIDLYGNPSYDFDDTVAFSGAEVVPARYRFVPAADSGSHTFPGTGFTFQVAGSRRLIVADVENGALADTSATIQVRAGPMSSFNLAAPSLVVAGSTFTASVAGGQDQYGNPASGSVSISASYGGGNSPGGVPPTYQDIVVNSGSGSASQRLTNAVRTVLRGQSGSFVDHTDTILVSPAVAQNMAMTGYPDTITAGQSFPAPVLVAVTDLYGNRSYDFDDTVAFSGAEVVPARYRFLPADSGDHSFPGASFAFQVAGSRRLIVRDVENSSLADTSSAIQVRAGQISSFNLTAPGSVNAGTAFALVVSNAVDQYNNVASGVVSVSAFSGGGNSPGGVPPVYNNVVVTNGSGSANQTLTNAVPTVLQGTSGGFTRYTGTITVSPGPASNLALTNYPDTITAGQTFPSPANDPVVRLTDFYGNPATTYTGTIRFTGAELVPAPYHFPGGTGVATFPGTSFRFDFAGNRRLAVFDTLNNALADTSRIIRVFSSGISSFALATPDTVMAGSPFAASVTNAVDQYGNPASGTVTISASYGGGISPGGIPPLFNNVNVTNGSGSAQQILTNVERTVIRGQSGGFIAYSDTMLVLPGPAQSLTLSNCPDTITAGATFPSPANDPVVTVRDFYGNLATTYTGTIAFAGADSMPGPFHFPGNTGQVAFAGTSFMFETAGPRRLVVADTSNGALADTSQVIQVFASAIDSFILVLTSDTVTAGQSFTLGVVNARDRFGNAASGMIVVSDSIGGGPSPDGTSPTFNNILVQVGSGSAPQILVRAGFARLKATAGSVMRVTGNLTVLPGFLEQLVMAVASPQVSGNPFMGPATLMAKDSYGNVKVNFNAAVDSIVVGSLPSGPMNNNVLRQSSDFVNGVADLANLGVTYSGAGGAVVFNATSQSGIYGESNVVEVISLRADNLLLDVRQVARGDSARGVVSFTNLSNLPVQVYDIDIFDNNSDLIITPVFSPPLPDTVPGGVDTTHAFSFEVAQAVEPGRYPLSMAVTGRYDGLFTRDTLDVFSDTLIVVSAAHLSYIDSSLFPTVVSRSEVYSFSLVLHNDGGSSVILFRDSTYVYFSDSTESYLAKLLNNSAIDPDSQETLVFRPIEVPSTISSGDYAVKLYVYGSDLGGTVYDSLTLSDSVVVQTAANITYRSGTLAPDTVVAGTEIVFSARMNNSGEASVQLRHDMTRISFGDGIHQYIAIIDTMPPNRIDEIRTGDTTLTFTAAVLAADFAAGNYQPVVHVAGVQNQVQYSVNLAVDSVVVQSRGQIRIDSLVTISLNPPKVNIGQPFVVHGYVNNLGAQPIDSVLLFLESDGNSDFDDSLDLGTVSPESGAAFDYNVNAALVPNAAELFHAHIIRAVERMTGQNALIGTPLDNAATAVIEDSATFWIDTLYLSDDSISTGQDFHVYAMVGHAGGNSYAGTNQLTIDFASDTGFVVEDSLPRDFIAGQVISWRVTAPDSERAAAPILVTFNGTIIDLNDSTTALEPDSVLSTSVTVTDRAMVVQRAAVTAPPGATDNVLSTGQTFTVTDSLFPHGNVASSYARLTLPQDFASFDPLMQPLIGETIEWQVRAAVAEMVDSIRLDCWTFDANTGDSIPGPAFWVPVETVDRANLALDFAITGPPSAMDHIIQPSLEFTLEAIVTNSGAAGVGQGELTLILGHPGFVSQEPLVRSFTADVPVAWHVTPPDVEILGGSQLACVMSTIPDDANTNEPAAVRNDSSGLTVIVKEELPRLVLRNPEPMRTVAVRGRPIDIYRFELENSSVITRGDLALVSLVFATRSIGGRVDPRSVVASLSVTIDDQIFDAVLNDSAAICQVQPPLVIAPDSLIEVMLSILLADDPSIPSFQVVFSSQNITARVVEGGAYGPSVWAILPDGSEFTLAADVLAAFETDFTRSVAVNNNPFVASSGHLEIGYNLEQDATIDCVVYSMNGDVVWRHQATPANGKGLRGVHYESDAIAWDGRNTAGEEVLSGVYYLFVTNSVTGQTAKMKIAVVW